MVERGRVVVTWRCSDGVEFDTQAAAMKHQHAVDLYRWIENRTTFDETHCAALTRAMIADASELCDLLSACRYIDLVKDGA